MLHSSVKAAKAGLAFTDVQDEMRCTHLVCIIIGRSFAYTSSENLAPRACSSLNNYAHTIYQFIQQHMQGSQHGDYNNVDVFYGGVINVCSDIQIN